LTDDQHANCYGNELFVSVLEALGSSDRASVEEFLESDVALGKKLLRLVASAVDDRKGFEEAGKFVRRLKGSEWGERFQESMKGSVSRDDLEGLFDIGHYEGSLDDQLRRVAAMRALGPGFMSGEVVVSIFSLLNIVRGLRAHDAN
jgi:hypothetical protein